MVPGRETRHMLKLPRRPSPWNPADGCRPVAALSTDLRRSEPRGEPQREAAGVSRDVVRQLA